MVLSIMRGLTNPDHPNARLRSLSIFNLQDCNYGALTRSDNFKAVLARIDSLELKIASYTYQENCRAPIYDARPEIEDRERHRFFKYNLRASWLEPVREHLTQLRSAPTTPL